MHGGWGIVTDRDLRTRVVAIRRRPSETPVGEIATFPVRTMPAETLAGEALLAMFAEGCHHFPVTGRGRRARRRGHRHRPHGRWAGTRRSRRRARSSGRERRGRRAGRAASSRRWWRRWSKRSADPIDVGRVVSLVVDAMTDAAAAARDRRARRPAVRLGVAGAGQRRAARAGAAYRPGPRARLRTAATGMPTPIPTSPAWPSSSPRASRPVASPGAAATPWRPIRACGGPSTDSSTCSPTWMDDADRPSHRPVVDRVRLPAASRGRSMLSPVLVDGGPASAVASGIRAPARPARARPVTADRVLPRSGRRGQGRARRASRHQARRHHDREQPRPRRGPFGRASRRRARSRDSRRPRPPAGSTSPRRPSWQRRSTSCGTSGCAIRRIRWRPASAPDDFVDPSDARAVLSERAQGGVPRHRAGAQRLLASRKACSPRCR